MEAHFYAGPTLPRLDLTTWDDVVQQAADGNLDETRVVELKEMPPAPSKLANLELARDAASLAVRGGLLIYGIVDDHSKAGLMVGVRHPGRLRDRVDQICRRRFTPASHRRHNRMHQSRARPHRLPPTAGRSMSSRTTGTTT